MSLSPDILARENQQIRQELEYTRAVCVDLRTQLESAIQMLADQTGQSTPWIQQQVAAHRARGGS